MNTMKLLGIALLVGGLLGLLYGGFTYTKETHETKIGPIDVYHRSCSADAPAPHLQPRTESTMNMTLSLAPIVSLIAGILILIVPRMLNYIVAIYLIVIGLLGLFGTGNFHLK